MRRGLTSRDKVLFDILIIAVVAFAYYYLLYNPTMNHIREQENLREELEFEIEMAIAYGDTLISTIETQEEMLSGIDGIINTYYPYVQPQYFVDLLYTFTAEHELTISSVDVDTPSLMSLSRSRPAEVNDKDALLKALEMYDILLNEALEAESEEEDARLIEPSAIVVDRLFLSLCDGDLEQYLGFLESVNDVGHPIYVSQCELAVNRFTDTLEMSIAIIIIHFDRLTESQYRDDASQFTFTPAKPAESEDNFDYH